MNVATITVDHVIRLDGSDQGPAAIEVGPRGEIRMGQPAHLISRRGKSELTAIPLLADAHAHLAISDGVTDEPGFHTLERADAQLRHLAARGVGHVLSLGTDQRWLQACLQQRLASGDGGDKAFGYSAGVGFGAADGWPPELTVPEPRYRPLEPELARRQVRELAGLGCRTLKIWVDDLGGKVPKVPRDVIHAIINEATQCGIITFAHVHFHEDAEALVSFGIGVLAHSISDTLMEPKLIDSMGEKSVTLVPTLSREEAEMAFSLDDNPYFRDEFFLRSERELVPRLRGRKFSSEPDRLKERLRIASANVALVHAAGVAIGLGTDSGFRMKLPGFAQHRELQLLNEAGVDPSSCLRAALETNQRLFANRLTSISPGEPASFFIVEGNVLKDIRATQNIRSVWLCGKQIFGSNTEL